jgi:hypothetical protein
LIPPYGGSNPPAPARQSGVPPCSPVKARMGRKCRLFARSTLSPDSQIGNRRAPIGESLRLHPRIFPFCRDCRRRPGSITTAARRPQSGPPVSLGQERPHWKPSLPAAIPAATLRERLPETLEAAERRERDLYGDTDEVAIGRVLKGYRDFVELCAQKEDETGVPYHCELLARPYPPLSRRVRHASAGIAARPRSPIELQDYELASAARSQERTCACLKAWMT